MNCPRCDQPARTEDLRLYGGVCPRCVLDFAAEQDAPSFPGLEILGLIGEGGMGVVYKARQTALDRIVALKVLSPRLSGDPEFAARFTREAKALAQLSHPNIVSIHESGIHDGVPYLVMEYVEGTSLRALLAGRKLAPERALEIVPQICDALHYAHARGVVHRDIKPENILIGRQGRVKIADFGLAKVGGEATRVTRSSAMMGTPNYMAPEQVENTAGVDHRADIYSLGVVFYEMLTGELPLGRFKAPSQRAAVDSRLDPVVLRSLEKEPEARYQQASEVKADVARVSEGRPVRAGKDALIILSSLGSLFLALADLLFLLWLFFLGGGDPVLWVSNVKIRLGPGDFEAVQFASTAASLLALLLGFFALGRIAARRSGAGAWTALAGVLLAAPLATALLLGNALGMALFFVPALHGAGGVLHRFSARDFWSRAGGLLFAAALSGLLLFSCALAAMLYDNAGIRDGAVSMGIAAASLGLVALALLAGAWLRRRAVPRTSLLAAVAILMVLLAAALTALSIGFRSEALAWIRLIPMIGAMAAFAAGTAARLRIARAEGRLRGRAAAIVAQYGGGALMFVAGLAILLSQRPSAPAPRHTPIDYGAHRQWETELGGPQLGVVSVGDRVFSASEAGLVEIDPVRGEGLGEWKGTISAPPTTHGEWMIVRGPERMVVFRPGDGPLEPWHAVDLPGVEDPTIADDVAYVGTSGGKALAVDLQARKTLWEREVGFPVASNPALLPSEAIFFGRRRNQPLNRVDGIPMGTDRTARIGGETPAFRAGAFRAGSGWAVLGQVKDGTALGTFDAGGIEWRLLPTALEPGPLELAEIEGNLFVRTTWGVRAWRPGTDTWFAAIEGALAAPVPLGPELAALPTRSGLRLIELAAGRILRTAFPDSWEEAVLLPHQGSLLILDRRSGSLKSIRLSGSRSPDPPGDTLSLVYSEKPYWPIDPPPAGVRILSSTEGEEALRRARLPAGMMKDLVRARRLTLAPGSVEHVELAFRTELALRRWFQDPEMAKRFNDPGEGAIGARVEILSVPAAAKTTGAVLQPRRR